MWREGLQCKKLFPEFLQPFVGSKGHYEGFALPENPVGGPCVHPKHQSTKQSTGRECSIPTTVSPCHGGDPLHQNSLNLGILAHSPWTMTEPRQGLVVNPLDVLKTSRVCHLAECAEMLPGFVFFSWLLFQCLSRRKSAQPMLKICYALLLGEMSSFWFPSELRSFYLILPRGEI